MDNNTFECSECERTLSAKRLSRYSHNLAGTLDTDAALDVLEDEDLLCKRCAGESAQQEETAPITYYGVEIKF